MPGGTLIIPSGPKGNHLFIILNEPKDFAGYINSSVLVNISSIRNAPYDKTCTLEPGSHPFIKHRSFIAYRHARVEREESLIQKVNALLFTPQEPLDGELLKRVPKRFIRVSTDSENFERNQFVSCIVNLHYCHDGFITCSSKASAASSLLAFSSLRSR